MRAPALRRDTVGSSLMLLCISFLSRGGFPSRLSRRFFLRNIMGFSWANTSDRLYVYQCGGPEAVILGRYQARQSLSMCKGRGHDLSVKLQCFYYFSLYVITRSCSPQGFSSALPSAASSGLKDFITW